MRYKTPNFDKSILDRVLPEYEKATGPGNTEFFKTMDENGNVLLCQNPRFWKREVDERGISVLRRTPPRVVMTYEEARRAAGSSQKKNNISDIF